MAQKTCVSIGVTSPAKLKRELVKALNKSEYTELRLDFLNASQVPDCLVSIRRYLGRCICTLRPKREGGRFGGTEKERVSILKLIAEFDPYLLDVEYNTLRNNKALQRHLKKTGTNLLVSWHDFTSTPNEKVLVSMAEKMSKLSRNIKIVTMAKDINDTLRVLNLYKKIPRKVNLIAFAMGDYGRMSRILCTRLGSPFTYVSLGKPVAQGQFSVNEMRSIFRLQ